MIILPESTATRFQQALQRNDYRCWLALSNYYMSLSRLAFADNSVYMASDLVMLSNVAHQLAVDMEPLEDEEGAESEADWYAELNRGYAQDRI